MLTADAINALLRAGESETLELKERFGADVIETAVAFANTHGGTILMGVRDDARIVGGHFGKEALRDYVNRIATATEPAVVPAACRVTMGEVEIIALQVSEVPLKPVATRVRSYCRAGSATRVSYMRGATQLGRRHFAAHDDPWQVLQKLELVESDTRITRAAILLFGKTPQSPLTQAVVHAGRLQQLVHVMDHRIIAGTLVAQVEEAMAFLQKNLHVRFEITGAPTRQEIWDYPLVALREALINAVCHRDYGDTADIQIKILEDSLHIWSPGVLPYGVSVQDLLNPVHTSRPRNKLIAQVFFDLGLIERYGGGIQRILTSCASAGLPPPELENFQGGFRIIFRQIREGRQTVEQVTPQVTPQVTQLLHALVGDSTRDSLMAQLGLKDREHFRTGYLAPAMGAGLVEMTLPDKPTSRLQKYRLTVAGRQMQAALLAERSAQDARGDRTP